jgi:hypothetical protein
LFFYPLFSPPQYPSLLFFHNPYEKGVLTKTADRMVSEYPLTVMVNGQEFVTLVCTPSPPQYPSLLFFHNPCILSNLRFKKRALLGLYVSSEGKTVDKRTTAVRDIYRYEKGVLTKTADRMVSEHNPCILSNLRFKKRALLGLYVSLR